MERFVASWMYNHKPLSEPVDYYEFESDSKEDSDSKGGSRGHHSGRRND